jgi:hypothetical protein
MQAQPREETSFLGLPRELRDIIYHLASAHSSPNHPTGYRQLCSTLLCICRTIRRGAAPIFWADHIGKHERYWNFRHAHVSQIRSFSNAMRPYTTATQMFWTARIHYKRGNVLNNMKTQTVTWNTLTSVLRQKADGNETLDRLAKNCKKHFDSYMGHGNISFSLKGKVCWIGWRWARNEFTREESIELRGPLAQLDWDFIASGEGDD